MTLAEFLQKFISKFDFLEAIILSDKEGIEVCGGNIKNVIPRVHFKHRFEGKFSCHAFLYSSDIDKRKFIKNLLNKVESCHSFL